MNFQYLNGQLHFAIGVKKESTEIEKGLENPAIRVTTNGQGMKGILQDFA